MSDDTREAERAPGLTPRAISFDRRPLLVFWETTKACPLACRHCRADAQFVGGPDELTTAEGRALIDDLATLGSPRPILVLTGGDCLMRDDLVELARYAHEAHLPVAVAPSVSPRLTAPTLDALREVGVKSASLSLDGAGPASHDTLRGIEGHFEATLEAIDRLVAHGFSTQVNTTVMPSNLEELADVAGIVIERGADVWEVFFLITTGRGSAIASTTPRENEDVCRFLVDASRYGVTVRTVEAPFFRRVALEGAGEGGPLYRRLSARLAERLGPARAAARAPSAATRDGKGIVFVGANGDVYPSGFLPLALGNVRESRLSEIYQRHPLLRSIRAAQFSGPCGRCVHANLCGGSRSRAFAAFGDPLASDPGCVLVAEPLASPGARVSLARRVVR